MLSIQNSKELKNLIVFHRHEVPTFIKDYKDMDAYQILKLDMLLLRMNVHHKTLFFADKPVFVEGYIDQQFFNILQYKRKIPLGAAGITIIDVGGKEEVDIMYKLCRLLQINAFCIVDMDGLFEGKLRQTVDKISGTKSFMARRGKEPLMQTIGIMDRLLNDVIDELLQYNNDNNIEQKEIKDFLMELKTQSKEKSLMRKRILFLGLHRIESDILLLLSEENKLKVTMILNLARDIFECFNSVNVYFLEKGEIENYYVTDIGNQYLIKDNKKTDYYLKEYQMINEENNREKIEKNYKDIIIMLDKICSTINVNTEKFVSAKVGDWIHNVQSILYRDCDTTIEVLKMNPRIQWDDYKRIVELIGLSKTESGFCCKFKILKGLVTDNEKVYSFDEKTVAANFKI